MSLKRTIISISLAMAALVGTTQAQPARSSDWQLRFAKQTRCGPVSIQFGKSGIGVDLTARRSKRITSHHAHAPQCRYMTGHYQNRIERVWRPGYTNREWVPALVEVTYNACGERMERVVQSAHWEYHQHPGHYEERKVRVWVQASCSCRSGGITAYSARRH